jgi:hypothetical protein
MTTVVSRVIRSSPQRDTVATWETIVEMLTKGKQDSNRNELLSVTGIAAAIIAERAPENAAIVVTCDGPRTRFYCVFDEKAIDDSEGKEDSLTHEPLKGEWAISIPCPKADLEWVQRALEARSTRITARDMSASLGESDSKAANAADFTIKLQEFLKS